MSLPASFGPSLRIREQTSDTGGLGSFVQGQAQDEPGCLVLLIASLWLFHSEHSTRWFPSDVSSACYMQSGTSGKQVSPACL